MSNTVGWLAALSALLILVSELGVLSASSWYAGWIAFVLAAVAAVMAFMHK